MKIFNEYGNLENDFISDELKNIRHIVGKIGKYLEENNIDVLTIRALQMYLNGDVCLAETIIKTQVKMKKEKENKK